MNSQLVYAGKMERAGVKKLSEIEPIMRKLDEIAIDKPPLKMEMEKPRARWVKPILKAHVVHRGGAARADAQGGSTVIPLSAFPLSDQYIQGSGTGTGEFQGVTLINPGATAASVTLQAMNAGGTVIATSAVTLNGGQVISRLVTEFFTGGLPPLSVIRVTSSSPLVVTAVTGSTTLDTMRSLPVLK